MTDPVRPEVLCLLCGGRAQWQPEWNEYMHWEESQEDTHGVQVSPKVEFDEVKWNRAFREWPGVEGDAL